MTHVGLVGELREEDLDDQRRRQHEHHGGRADHDHHEAEQRRRQLVGAFALALREEAGEDRHEGSGERPFAKQPAKQVWNGKGYKEGVGGARSPAQPDDYHFANHAQYARNQGEDGHELCGPEEVLTLLVMFVFHDWCDYAPPEGLNAMN